MLSRDEAAKLYPLDRARDPETAGGGFDKAVGDQTESDGLARRQFRGRMASKYFNISPPSVAGNGPPHTEQRTGGYVASDSFFIRTIR
jgi:hypothetical protein